MSHYYFGYGYGVFLSSFIIFALLGGWAFYSYSKTKMKAKFKIAMALFGLSLLSVFVVSDLNSYIDKSKNAELDDAMKASHYYLKGEQFRKYMGDLAKERGVLVDSNTSYIGKDIYLTYITKADWNKLANEYNQLGLPKLN